MNHGTFSWPVSSSASTRKTITHRSHCTGNSSAQIARTCNHGCRPSCWKFWPGGAKLAMQLVSMLFICSKILCSVTHLIYLFTYVLIIHGMGCSPEAAHGIRATAGTLETCSNTWKMCPCALWCRAIATRAVAGHWGCTI